MRIPDQPISYRTSRTVGHGPAQEPAAGHRRAKAKALATGFLRRQGELGRLEFQLKEEEKAPPPPPPVVDTKKKIPWVAWGVTGGIAAGAAVTGVLALVFNADAKSKLGTLGSTADDITGAEGRAHAFALVTDILIGGAILSGGISFILTVTAKSEPVPAPAAAPAARLVIGPGSVGVVGTF